MKHLPHFPCLRTFLGGPAHGETLRVTGPQMQMVKRLQLPVALRSAGQECIDKGCLSFQRITYNLFDGCMVEQDLLRKITPTTIVDVLRHFARRPLCCARCRARFAPVKSLQVEIEVEPEGVGVDKPLPDFPRKLPFWGGPWHGTIKEARALSMDVSYEDTASLAAMLSQAEYIDARRHGMAGVDPSVTGPPLLVTTYYFFDGAMVHSNFLENYSPTTLLDVLVSFALRPMACARCREEAI